MRQPKLSDSDVAARLAALPAWGLTDGMIRRTFIFADFVAAIAFVNAIADAAEQADHHPDIDIRYNKVTLALTTHDSGGLTVNDFALAERADALAGVKYTVLADHVGIAIVVQWEKAIGQFVALGEPLLTLHSTDGAELSILSPTYGVLFKRVVLTGEAVEAGEPLAVLAGVTEPQVSAPAPDDGYVPVGPEERHTPDPRWQRLAQHHAASLTLAPQVYTTLAVDLSQVVRLQAKTGAPLAAFAVAAMAAALRTFPLFNAAWLAPDDVRLRHAIHIALPQPEGTFPVLLDADRQSVMALTRALAAPAQLPQRGATATLTLGEAQTQTPILHQPQSAHLYLGTTGVLCLAHDARVADGFAATAFLKAIRASLEETQFLFV